MAAENEPWFLRSTYPVLFPTHSALNLSSDEFEAFIKEDISRKAEENEQPAQDVLESDVGDSFTMVSTEQSTTVDVRDAIKNMDIEVETEQSMNEATPEANGSEEEQPTHPFIKGLTSYEPTVPEPGDMENKMLTENLDLAHRSTENPLVDLFASLDRGVTGPLLFDLLVKAWTEDPLITLKIIFNARSIHLGKSDKITFYRCAGWLAEHKPLTLITNLRWLSRPLIQKKVEKKDGEEDDIVVVEPEKDDKDVSRFDVRNGVSHGYWKDLLNILALSVNGLLNVSADPHKILNIKIEGNWPRHGAKVKKPSVDKVSAKIKRHQLRDERHQKAIECFESDPVHRALHMTVARLFAEQLREDMNHLRSSDPKMKSRISLCAKWAPSHKNFHDRHTFIVSTIAELLHPIAGEMDRELYLRHARELYRKDVSALRQHLDVVERNLTANTLEKIKYDRVPSVAMKNYAPIFEKKDKDRFTEYIDRVAEGKARISGATLLPSTLIRELWISQVSPLALRVVDGQWRALVQRIKDSGTMGSSIAVCDTSGSMTGPMFRDGCTPLDSAIGLSLLVAEVTAPPFGGHFITFSAKPEVQAIDLEKSLMEKYQSMKRADWGMNTDFVAVFEDLILPMAKREQLKPEDMVKRIFVFSDMQFDQAQTSKDAWTTSYERIKQKFAEAGYEMPEMVFWNLRGGSAYQSGLSGDPVPPKPVTVRDDGTALVSGYSQGMLKVFLDNGSFEGEEETTEEEDKKEEGAAEDESEGKDQDDGSPKKKRKIDPLSTVKKAVGHKAYDMLQVVE